MGDNEEEVDEVDEVAEEQPDELVPDEKELRTELVETVFGGNYFPEIVRKKKPQRSGVSERHGRGGRNEVFKKDASENLVLGVVDYMLENDGKNKEGTLNLTSLFKKRGGRKKKRADVDVFSDEDDYVAPNYMISTSAEGSRKSKRLTMRLDSE